MEVMYGGFGWPRKTQNAGGSPYKWAPGATEWERFSHWIGGNKGTCPNPDQKRPDTMICWLNRDLLGDVIIEGLYLIERVTLLQLKMASTLRYFYTLLWHPTYMFVQPQS